MDDLAGIILGILGAGLLIALANGGWSGHGGAKDWFNAKFLGRPGGAAAPAIAPAAAAAPPVATTPAAAGITQNPGTVAGPILPAL